MKRLLTACLLIFVATLAPANATPPPDSDAPPGARWDWLPDEEWVMERWTPFNEQSLYTELGLGEHDVIVWVSNDKALLSLARRKHVPLRNLAARLVRDSWGVIPAKRRATLELRATRVLTQPHLGQHMLRHEFHTWSVWRHTHEIFVSAPREN